VELQRCSTAAIAWEGVPVTVVLVCDHDVLVLQLNSLYECKPPISRAKMTQLTKAAIKAIKVRATGVFKARQVGGKMMPCSFAAQHLWYCT